MDALDESDELSVSQGLVVVKKKPCPEFRQKGDGDFSSELKVRSGLTSLQVTALNCIKLCLVQFKLAVWKGLGLTTKLPL